MDKFMDFIECAACRAKPGSPNLCPACLHNRTLVSALKAEIRQLRFLLLEIRNATTKAGD